MGDVLSGKHEKSLIHISKKHQCLYIELYGNGVYLSQNTIQSIENQNIFYGDNSGDALLGGIIGGTTGAIIGSSKNNSSRILTIVWKDGLKSLVKLSEMEFESLLIGMTKEIDSNVAYLSDKEEEESAFWLKFFLTIGWTIFCIIVGLSE